MGKLLDGTECKILLDIGANKSFTSKSHYLRCKALHSLPKLAPKTQRIQVEMDNTLVCCHTNSNRHTWS